MQVDSNLAYKVEQLEERVKRLEPKVDDCLVVASVLTELKVIVKNQVARSEKMDNVLSEQNKTLVKQGEILVAVLEQMKRNSEDMQELKIELEDIKEDSTIKTSELVRYVLFGGLGAFITYLSSIFLK